MLTPNGDSSHGTPLPAFSLIELLAAISVIAIIAAILVPIINSVQRRSYVTQSVNNLRQLQLANLTYASDHGGEYVPLSTVNDNGSISGQWMYNRDFGAYLNCPKPGYTDKTWLPVAISGFPATPIPDYPGIRTIGYNGSDFDGKDLKSFRTSEINYPERLIAFAEAIDWQVKYGSRHRWTAESDEGKKTYGAIAYRNGGNCIAVMYSGVVTQFSEVEADDLFLWFNQPQ
ncbi:prepilin-type N-terminal cleavage/methylation domain-containing protein [Ruficoccus sp. ZRK36]|uniref:prepilin-type N-terminal cleavage/methylation domain-containing protein n=1 Tax=Ruficoccus sp. ZRK36 TaxID=2866311 RepID=UPI001C733FAE|nr:prepilin-type N-terminal cleavage/methylation domain-containing protein [Ruficoccus sp. ZRK36]QYY36701.1 prepilin-type N-terminal cleavage/methylation domain-containing protein [Ruficoccus sp. ZRK36]